jgi:hypothetical protein
MPFQPGYKAVIKIGGVDLSPYTASVSLSGSREALDVTTLGNAAKVYIPGQSDATLSLEGHYDPLVQSNFATWQASDTPVSWEYGPQGSEAGKPKLTGSGIVTSFEPGSDAGDVGKWSAEFQVTGPITVGTYA